MCLRTISEVTPGPQAFCPPGSEVTEMKTSRRYRKKLVKSSVMCLESELVGNSYKIFSLHSLLSCIGEILRNFRHLQFLLLLVSLLK